MVRYLASKEEDKSTYSFSGFLKRGDATRNTLLNKFVKKTISRRIILRYLSQ